MKLGKNKIKVMVILITLLFSLEFALAKEDIKTEIIIPSYFQNGEILSFTYKFLSEIDSIITIKVGVECSHFYMPSTNLQILNLKSNEVFIGSYDMAFVISDLIEPQTCTAYIEVLSPVRKRVEKTFEIKTNPSFKFDILFDKKVFIRNENVNINFESSVENPSIKVNLIYPNKKIEEINLPYLFKAEQIGTYTLDVTASKEGYKTITKKEQFGVIEKEANIPYTDLPKINIEKKEFNKSYILIGLIVLLIFIIFYLKKKKK